MDKTKILQIEIRGVENHKECGILPRIFLENIIYTF